MVHFVSVYFMLGWCCTGLLWALSVKFLECGHIQDHSRVTMQKNMLWLLKTQPSICLQIKVIFAILFFLTLTMLMTYFGNRCVFFFFFSGTLKLTEFAWQIFMNLIALAVSLAQFYFHWNSTERNWIHWN